MSLDFNLQTIKDVEEVCYTKEGRVAPETEALIWATMTVGMNGISEENIPEWLYRIAVLKRTSLSWLGEISSPSGIEGWYPDEDTLRKYIGLGTNASTYTRAAFWKKVKTQIDEEVSSKVVC